MMTPSILYSFKNAVLPVPPNVLSMLQSLQLTPIPQQVFSKKYAKYVAPNNNSWRTSTIVSTKCTAAILHEDPDFDAIQGICNKMVASTLSESVARIMLFLSTRDQLFRMKVISLIFSRGVAMPFFAKMMANTCELMFKTLPIVKEDLQFSASVESFNKMFDQTETVLFPTNDTANYDDAVCAWNKKKEIRRGFGIFVTELYIRGLVDEDVIESATTIATDDLREMVRKPLDERIVENVNQLVTFLFETTKVITTRFGSNNIVKKIKAQVKEIVGLSRDAVPCLCMRSRFKLEDTGKL